MKKRFSEEQIIGFLREADAGMPVKDLHNQRGLARFSTRDKTMKKILHLLIYLLQAEEG